ncbi:MAG TPA: YggS family pyridoxal phosphate-dependent enzyme [bacterium]|nr:YggS family pyridoxal phosphate-dependent enzyme [bacterium]
MGAAEFRVGVTDVPARVARVRERVAAAAMRSGRRSEDVRLIAVTKDVDVGHIRAAIAAGVEDLGENRVQEAARKIEALGRGPRWHMVGHLQRNKVAQAVALFDVIHSIDGAGILRELSRRPHRPIDVLLQVNVAGEPQKHGLTPDGLIDVASDAAQRPGLRVIGLMTIAPMVTSPEAVRPVFRQLRALRDELNQRAVFRSTLVHLSMGMTDDFEVAVEEGATMVRIGRGIFGERG